MKFACGVALTLLTLTPVSAFSESEVKSNETQVTPVFDTHPNKAIDFFEDILSVFGAEENYDSSKGLDASYIPAVFYTPEQGLGLGLLFIGLYGDTNGGRLQPSSLIINPYYSSNGSMGMSIENRYFLPNDKNRLYLDLDIYQDTGVYFGKGLANGRIDSNQINYAERASVIEPTWLTKVADNFYFGVGANINHAEAKSIELEYDTGDLSKALDLAKNTSYGLSLSSVYDSRNNVSNASKGALVDIGAGYYHSSITDEWFGEYHAEYAQYQSLGSFPGLLAWQVQGEFTSGDVPWNRLPDLGGDDAMRGYLQGRYRDNQMAMAQMEYRVPIYWRVGMVFWGGVGSIASQVSDLTDDLVTTYGTGFRFKIKDQVNVRADIGFGEDETSFYFHVNEVF